jgi:hypothetical protein
VEREVTRGMLLERFISFAGYFAMIGLAWLLS